MIGAFNSVYSALQGFFTRAFWFSAFLPVAIFSLIHALLAKYVLGQVSIMGFTLTFEGLTSTVAVTGASFIMVTLVVIAYALQPLMPRLRGWLDGSLLPALIHDWLRKRRLAAARAAAESISEARDELGAVDHYWQDAHAREGRFATAYASAEKLASAKDTNALAGAQASLKTLRVAVMSSAPLKPAVEAALAGIVALLKVNNPTPDALANQNDPDERRTARATDKASDDFEEFLGQARREALYRFQVLNGRYRTLGALDMPRATLVGDARFVVERYPYDVYQVGFDFLWPRLLMAMKAEKPDDPTLDAIDQAQAKVDFAVLSLALATTIPVIWLPVIFLSGRLPWLFLAIGAAAPVVLGLFYELVFESQLALGDVIKTAIDRSRFLVLKMLHQPEPASRAEECELWARIAAAEANRLSADIFYTRTASTAATK